MNFILDGADFLVIIVILVTYFVSRRMERTSRTLESVRRYANKSKNELDIIVRERETGLRNISANLEEHEKKNREILARVEHLYKGIFKRTEHFQSNMVKIETQEKALDNLDKLAGKVDENLHRLKEESSYIDEVGSRLSEIKKQFGSIADRDAERFDRMRKEFYSEIQSELASIKTGLGEYNRQIETYRENLQQINSGNMENTREHTAKFEVHLQEMEDDFYRRINSIVDKAGNLEEDMYLALNEKIQLHIQELESSSEKEINNLEDRLGMKVNEAEQSLTKAKIDFELWETRHQENLDTASRGLEKSLAEMEASREEWQNRNNVVLKGQNQGLREKLEKIKADLEEWEKNIDERMQQYSLDFGNRESKIYQMSADIGKDIGELEQKFDRAIQNKELDMLEEVEKRQDDYKAVLERKFIQIEASIKDVDRTKDLLKSSQENVIQDIEKQFSNFDMKMTQIRVEEKNSYDNEAGKIREDMENLEKELEDLKARAYDNVSEKLQIFEDDFFKTLKDRDAEIKSGLEDWQCNADKRLEDLSVRSNREREEIEHRYSVELDKSLNDFQTRILKQFSDFQEQTDGFRDSLNSRFHASEELLGDFQNDIRSSISEHRQSALEDFSNSYSEFSTQVEGKFAKANKIIRQKLQNSVDEIQKQHRMLVEEIGTSRGELSDWQNRLEIQIGEVESNTSEAVKIIKKKLADTVQELNDDFASRSEQLILCSGESQSEIKRQIVELEDALSNLTQDMNGKIQSSLDILKDQSESFLLDFRKSSRDARDEMDRKVKELRQSVQESRERAENSRREMVTHTESEYSRLMRNVDDIDRRQREFIAETRIFERADEMKEALESDMANLKAQIDSVNTGREEVRQINEQYRQAISLHTEINNRLGKLNIEQNKLEGLEARMIRINNLSDSVDLKLKQVNDANDILQGLNIKLKQLEKQHETLDDRYQHLTEKSSVLDATNDGVDNSFQLMTRLQSEIESVVERISPLSEQIEIVRERQNRIEQDSQKVEAVVGKIGSIDSTIHELDRRVQDLLKAREWLARTESRLKEINEETHQNLRLMSTLSQGTVPKKSSGSPDMSTREIVVKLARQGWDSEEIARNTRLSQGEVELILELTPNKP